MLKFLTIVLFFCIISNSLSLELIEIRHNLKLLGSCLDVKKIDYENAEKLDFSKKYEIKRFDKYENINQFNLNTNITEFTQKEYCGIGVQLCYNLHGHWSNYKLCNIY